MKLNRRIRLDRIGSATRPAKVGEIVEVSPDCRAEEGAVIVVRALGDKRVYGELELPTGRMAKVIKGNILCGVLGARRALHGYMGRVPDAIAPGDTIHLLNIGGVLGISDTVPSRDLGPPIPCEVLGQVTRGGSPLNIGDFSLPPCAGLAEVGPPLVLVLGTCMNSGKTFAAAEIIRLWSRAGKRVAAGKLSGVAALKDTFSFLDNGAIATASFLDCGYPSTVNTPDLASVARAVVQHLERSNPEVIVLELGDGIIGGYNTGSILHDPEIRRRTGARVLCANDLVGTWGGVQFLQALHHAPDVISGPVTDNMVGISYVEEELRLGAANARVNPRLLAELTAQAAGLPVELEP